MCRFEIANLRNPKLRSGPITKWRYGPVVGLVMMEEVMMVMEDIILKIALNYSFRAQSTIAVSGFS